jgi:hypothetical protein
MNITFKDSNNNEIIGKWCYDVNGNVYVDVNGKFYIFEIDKNNNLEFNLIENDIFKELSDEYKVRYNKIINLETDSLKKKVLEEIDKSDSDRDEDYQNYRSKMKCLEEDKYYVAENNENENDEFDEVDDVEYKFYQKGNTNCMIFLNKGLETSAIYDTYVRDRDKNVMLSLQSDCNNSYRISIYENNLVELNIIGAEIKKENALQLLQNVLNCEQNISS